MPFAVYAPGKLVLIGEYAVLHGAPAVVAAIDRRLRIEIAPRNQESRLNMPHLGLSGLPLENLRDSIDTSDGRLTPAEKSQVRCVVDIINCFRRMVDFGRTAPPPMELTVDARALYSDRGIKLGLGSSAALTVAMIAGLYAHARGLKPQREVLFKHALAVHRHLQGETGSGIDVAASVFGGFSFFQQANGKDYSPPILRPIEWPAEIHMTAVWTGQPASTAQLLTDLDRFAYNQHAYYRIKMNQLITVSKRAVRALEHRDADGFIDAADQQYRLLTHLTARSGVPIITVVDQKLATMAQNGGGVYKPSGAGGGDIGLVLTDTPEKLVAIEKTISDAGYHVLDVKWGAEGVSL